MLRFLWNGLGFIAARCNWPTQIFFGEEAKPENQLITNDSHQGKWRVPERLSCKTQPILPPCFLFKLKEFIHWE